MTVEGKDKTQNKQRRMFLFLPLKRIVPYAGLIIGIFMIIFQHSLWSYTEGIVGRVLIDIIRLETKGKYTINYEKVRFSIINDQLSLTNFSVIEENNSTDSEKVSEQKFALHSSLLSMNVSNFLDVLIRRQIHVEKLELAKPAFTIVDFRNISDADTVENESGMIYTLVTRYLNEFKIKELAINNASLDYTKVFPDTIKNYKLSNISLKLNQFGILNPLQEGEQVLSSNHFEFELLNDSIRLFPGHLIKFKKLRGSSIDSIVRVEAISIIPDKTWKNKSLFEVTLPYAELTGFDPRNLLFGDSLQSDKFRFGDGKIRISIKPGQAVRSRKILPEFILAGIEANNMTINLTFPMKGVNHVMSAKGLEFTTSNLDFQNTDFRDLKSILNQMSFDIKAREFTIDFSSIQHRLNVKNVVLNLNDSYFSFEDLYGFPYGPSNSKYVTRINRLQLWDLDLDKVLNTNSVELNKILVQNLNLNINTNSKLSSNRKIDFTNIYSITGSVFPLISIKDFQIIDSNILYKDLRTNTNLQLDDLNVHLNQIYIDSLAADSLSQILGAQDISISGNGINLKFKSGLNEFRSGLFDLNSFKKTMLFEDMNYTSSYPTSRIYGASKLDASGLNWNRLINEKDLLMDTLLIVNPSISLDKLDSVYLPDESVIRSYTTEFADSLLVHNLSIRNGTLDIRDFNDVQIKLNEIGGDVSNIQVFKIDYRLHWNLNRFNIENGPFSIILNNRNQKVTGKMMSISKSDSTLRLNQLNIMPINRSAENNRLMVTVPNIILSGIDIAHLLDSNLVVTKQVSILNPTIAIRSNGNYGLEENDERIEYSTKLRFLSNEISILNAKISAEYGLDNLHRNYINTDWLDLTIHDFHLSPKNPISPDLEFMDHFELVSEGFAHSRFSSLDTLYIQRLHLNSKSNFLAEGISTSGSTDNVIFSAEIPRFNLSTESLVQKIIRKDYALDSILISGPDLDLEILDTVKNAENQSEKIPLTILMGQIQAGKMNLKFKEQAYTIPVFNMTVDQFDLSKPESQLYSKDISLQLKELKNVFPSTNSIVDISDLSLSTYYETLQIKDLQSVPRYGKLEYGQKMGYQTDWIKFQAEKINFTGLDYFGYLENDKLKIGEVLLDSIDLHVYRDKNVPLEEVKIRPMPQEAIRQIDMPFTIEALIAYNANITYEELAEEAEQSGFVEFSNLTAGISNITNDSTRLTENNIMMIGSNTDFMHSGNLQADFEFNLTDPGHKFKYTAYLSKMPLTILNNILEPNANVLIKSGNMNKMRVEVNGNEDFAIGSMQFLYNDLHFNLISKKTGTTSAMGPAIGTFFANTFIVNRNNPKLLLPRNGDVYYERDTTKSIFNYLSKTILSGVVSSIGARNNRKYIRRVNKEAKEEQERKEKRDQNNQEAIISTRNE